MHTYHHLQARYFTRGRLSPPRLVVIHCTQGSTAAGAARWFTNAAAGGSAHIVVDDTEVWRCVNDGDTAWHAKGHNSFGLGLEIAGFAQWTEPEWMLHKPRLDEAARIHAGWCRKYGIPLQSSQSHGYHPHAGLPGNDHWDPGKGFPWAYYLNKVSWFLGLPTDPKPLPYGRSLRIIRDPSSPKVKRWGGWTEDEVPPNYDGPALGALKALARIQGPLKRPFILTWRGGKWEDREAIPRVARTILNRYVKEQQ